MPEKEKNWWEDPEHKNWWEDPEHFLAKMAGPSSIGVRELFLEACKKIREKVRIIEGKDEEIQALKKQMVVPSLVKLVESAEKEENAVIPSLVKLVESVEEDPPVYSNLAAFVTAGTRRRRGEKVEEI